MSHASISDRKIYKALQYHVRNDKIQGLHDPNRRPLKVSDIYELYAKQNGLDYWTDITMLIPDVGTSLFQVSIDRLDSSKPHVLGNIVLCCMATNLCRNAASAQELLNYLQEVAACFDPTKPRTLQQLTRAGLGKNNVHQS